jgi:sortase A
MVIGIMPTRVDGIDGDDGDEVAVPGGSDDAPAPGPVRTGPPTPGLLQLVLAAAMVCSVAALFLGAFAFGLSGLQEQRSQHLLYAEFRGLLDPSSTVAPSIGGRIPAGTPVALVNAPGAGLHQVMVVEGTTSGDLLAGPGHRPDTPLPGQRGASIVVGRSATAGAPFAGLAQLRHGAVIRVRTGQGAFRYTVVGRVAVGQALPAFHSNSSLLVLVTSAGSGWAGKLTSDHLVYVVAKLDGTAVTAPPGRPRSVPPAAVQGHNDPAGLPFALGWLVVLMVVSALCWRSWYRWGLLRTWLIGAPVLFAVLWAFGNESMRLLPNVY